jgi:hypothetical protein
MTTTATKRINFEVVWGPEPEDRVLYADYGDGSFISRTADARATSKFLEMIRYGVRVGFFRDGVLEAGQEPIFPAEEA